MALANYEAPMIHHSDRGGQYIYGAYIKLLKDNKCKISMSKSSQDNAYAERINRTIKEEYLDHWRPSDFKTLKQQTEKAVENYNNKRIHNNLDRMKPVEFYKSLGKTNKTNKKVITIFNNEI
jgi:transposase InsO family protein